MINTTSIQDLGFIFFEMQEDMFLVINQPKLMEASQRKYFDAAFRFIKENQLCCLSELYYCTETAMTSLAALRTEILENLGTTGGTCSFVQGKPIHGQDICGYVIHAAKTALIRPSHDSAENLPLSSAATTGGESCTFPAFTALFRFSN